ncbi:MAG: regulatory protein RecX [Halothiobacillaceae bacterium]
MSTGTAEDAAVRLLAHREHARAELARKLRDRGYAAYEISEALDALEARDWLSDRRYAESFLRSRIAKHQGPFKIRAELRKNGVDEDVIEAALAEQAVDWLELAREQVVRRFGAEAPADERERARRFRHLQARGFSGEVARRAIDPQ